MKNFSLIGATGANTGQILGDASRGIIRRLAIFGGKITAAEYANSTALGTKLAGASLLSKSDSNKLFILPEVQNVEDKSEANKEGALNQGFKTVLLEGKPAYEVKVFGSSEFAKAVRKYNNKTVRLLEIDSNDKMWGVKTGTDFIGFQSKVFVNGQKGATGQNVEEGIVTITISVLDTSEYYDSAKCVDVSGIDITTIQALVDADLKYISNATNVYKIGVSLPTGDIANGYNLYQDYANELAVGALWVAKTGTNFGTALTITSVAKDAANECWTVTFDSTAFTALAAGSKIKLSLVDPAALDAAGVSGVEGVAVILTK